MGIHAALVVHPDAGCGAAARVAGTVAARLRDVVDRLALCSANTVEQAREWFERSRHETGDRFDVLVVLGGDGAVHEALQYCAETRTPLGVVPCGTGNDFARGLRLPTDPRDAVEVIVTALREGHSTVIDLGAVEPGDAATGRKRRWFSTVLCAGFDAMVNERANSLRWPNGPRRYDAAILYELAALRSRRLVVESEHERIELVGTLVAVGNTSSYGGGIPVCPDADPGDGLLDVTLVAQVARHEMVRMLPYLRNGNHTAHPAVRTLRARSITLFGNDWPVYADGEPLGTLPVTARCVPGSLTVLGRG